MRNLRARPRLEEWNCKVSKDSLSFKHRRRLLHVCSTQAKFPPPFRQRFSTLFARPSRSLSLSLPLSLSLSLPEILALVTFFSFVDSRFLPAARKSKLNRSSKPCKRKSRVRKWRRNDREREKRRNRFSCTHVPNAHTSGGICRARARCSCCYAAFQPTFMGRLPGERNWPLDIHLADDVYETSVENFRKHSSVWIFICIVEIIVTFIQIHECSRMPFLINSSLPTIESIDKPQPLNRRGINIISRDALSVGRFYTLYETLLLPFRTSAMQSNILQCNWNNAFPRCEGRSHKFALAEFFPPSGCLSRGADDERSDDQSRLKVSSFGRLPRPSLLEFSPQFSKHARRTNNSYFVLELRARRQRAEEARWP